MSSTQFAARQAQDRLEEFAQEQGLEGVQAALRKLPISLRSSMEELEDTLHTLLPGGDLASRSAQHLLLSGGKRLRPLLCLLSANCLDPAPPGADLLSLALAAEAIHAATLLHDDVIDQGSMRRGVDSARIIFGNSASVLGGDLLLVRALELIRQTGHQDLLAEMLEVLALMVSAEALQLERRGHARLTRQEYHSIASGKTASLFSWAARAGVRSLRRPELMVHARSLGTFGEELGMAFQIRDDLLDLTGAPGSVGKNLVACVREGTITYPVLVALERQPKLSGFLEKLAVGSVENDDFLVHHIQEVILKSGGLEEAATQVEAHTRKALQTLESLPESPARKILTQVAQHLTKRSA